MLWGGVGVGTVWGRVGVRWACVNVCTYVSIVSVWGCYTCDNFHACNGQWCGEVWVVHTYVYVCAYVTGAAHQSSSQFSKRSTL